MIQLQVLNYILQKNDSSLITLNNLNQEYFSEYKDEFNFIKDHIDRYDQVPDLPTFLNKFNHFEVIEVNENTNYLLSELTKDKNTRYMAMTFNKIKDLLEKGQVDDAMTLYRNSYDGLSNGVNLSSVDITKDITRYNDYVERLNDFSKYYISTGFSELDKIIGGWDREEELATIVARTNYGKSWILLKCAAAAVEQGLNVGLYSGEMSERKVGYRFDTLVGHISNGGLIHGNDSIRNEYKRYIDSLPTRFKGSLKVLTPKMINGPAGVNALRAFIEKENLDMLFIDQHSLLEDDRHARTPVEKAANISRDLKNLQVMSRIPIISVSQQNRSTSENGVDTTQIAQSDRIGQDSTVILFLEKKDNEIKIHLVKSRDSENGKVLKYMVDLNQGYFTYIPDDNKDESGNEVDGNAKYLNEAMYE